jgi:hypothetical protein
MISACGRYHTRAKNLVHSLTQAPFRALAIRVFPFQNNLANLPF